MPTIKIHCIKCDTVKEVELNRGRPRYFCSDSCRLKAFRISKRSDEKRQMYDEDCEEEL
jgi:hypothetical protein